LKKLNHINLNVTTVLCLLALSLVMTLVAGCSSNAVAPSTDSSSLSQLNWLNSKVVPGQDGPEPRTFATELTASSLIGPKGGVIVIAPQGSSMMPAQFIFPNGALKVETLITVRASLVETPFGNLVVYDCGPDGTVFDEPVLVVQSEPRGKTEASLYYFNEKTQQWELQETNPAKGGSAVFHIYHFSKYGISR
jgi:hypothetical protein